MCAEHYNNSLRSIIIIIAFNIVAIQQAQNANCSTLKMCSQCKWKEQYFNLKIKEAAVIQKWSSGSHLLSVLL